MTLNDHENADQFAAHLDRGWDLVARGDFAGALVSAQKSLEINEQSAEAHNLVGYIHQAEGHGDEAVEHYKKALEIDDTFVEAMLNAAEVMISQKDFDGAFEMIDEALDLVDNDEEIADALLLKFDAQIQSGDKDAAKRTLSIVPEGPFDNANLEFLIGRAKLDLDDVDGAEPHLRRSIERAADNSDAHYYLGILLEKRGDKRHSTVEFLLSRELDARLGPAPWSLEPPQFEKRVERAIGRLPEALQKALNEALVIVSELPGAEVVADAAHPVDPRAPMLLDDVAAENEPPRVGRVFVYQRNVERIAPELHDLDDELVHLFEDELVHCFPVLKEHVTSKDEPPVPN